MDEKAQAVYGYIMERCLWQFFSRSWDRERNINGIMKNVALLYSNREVSKETNLDKCYYADARILLDQLMEKFSWFSELSSREVHEIADKVTEKLLILSVTNSLNAERTQEHY